MRMIYNIAKFPNSKKLKDVSVNAKIKVYLDRKPSNDDCLYIINILLNHYDLLRIRKDTVLKFGNNRFYTENEFAVDSQDGRDTFNNFKEAIDFLERKYSLKFNKKIFNEVESIELLQEMSE